jgi:very-short-patch-repair endonuclease
LDKAKKSNNFHYNQTLLPLARANRKNMTKSAACMWKYVLSKKQMNGYQFRRERPILNYIVDFVCLELMLIIEVDGMTHDDEVARMNDLQRDQKLNEVGFTVLRFSSWEVLNEITDVGITIGEWIRSNA